jgi:hypothetical protein
MESVGDLVIVVDDILPFLANVYLHNKGTGQHRTAHQYHRDIRKWQWKTSKAAAWELFNGIMMANRRRLKL